MGITLSTTEKYVLRTSERPIGSPPSGPGKKLIPPKIHDINAEGSGKRLIPPKIHDINAEEGLIVHNRTSIEKAPSSKTLEKGSSSKALERSISSKLSSGRFVSSAILPWLLKQANFSSAALNDFDFGRVIGTGLMGVVRICKLKNKSSYVAIKIVQKDYVQRHKDERHIENEEKILCALRSPFCIKLFAKLQDEKCFYFVMELVPGGELFRRLSKKECFQPQTAKFYATEVFAALYHIQSLGFVYRDLKPENVLLDEEGHCKLVDFGFSTEPDSSGMMKTVCGTPAYLSPEQLNSKFTCGYSSVVDFWSFGVFLYELLTGLTPFCRSNTETPYEIYLRVLNAKIYYPRKVDAASKQLISDLCFPAIEQRLTDKDRIRSHSYFTMDWDAVNKRMLVPPYVPKFDADGDSRHFDDYKGF